MILPLLPTWIASHSAIGVMSQASVGIGFSEIIGLIDLESMGRLQRQLLRQFIMTEDQQTARDQVFVATLESLIELVLACMCKNPQYSSATSRCQPKQPT